MAFNEELVKTILGKEDVSVDDKVIQLMSEYNADLNGLKQNRDKWQTEVATQKATLEKNQQSISAYEKQIADLTEQIKNKSDNKDKEFFDSQLKLKDETFAKERNDLLSQIQQLNNYKLDIIKRNAISKGVEGLKFVDDNLKDAFVQLILAREDFRAENVGGETKFLQFNRSLNQTTGKELSDVIKEYSTSDIGKSFLANGNAGGGGGNKTPVTTPVQTNPFAKGSENLDLQMKMFNENPALAKQLAQQAGVEL